MARKKKVTFDKTDRYEKVDQPAVATKEKSLAIVAMGSSNHWLLSQVLAGNKPHDEIWACNTMAYVMNPAYYDMIWVMDNILEEGHRWPEETLKAMLASNRPIMTSISHPDWQGKETLYPLAEVLKFIGTGTRPDTNTAYAFIYALIKGYKNIYLYGTDFAVPQHLKDKFPKGFQQIVDTIGMEYNIEGARCMTFWIALAIARGIKVTLPPGSLLIPTNTYKPDRPFYGYPKDFKLEEPKNGNE